MANLLPLLLIGGAAAIAMKKKKKKSSSGDAGTGEPDGAPGSGYDGSTSPSINTGMDGWIKSSSAKSKIPPPSWNDYMAKRARDLIEQQWNSGDQKIHGAATWFLLQRNTAMAMWPHFNWPKTMAEEEKVTYVPPGSYVPNFIYNAGEHAAKIQEIWSNLKTIAWEIMDFHPVT